MRGLYQGVAPACHKRNAFSNEDLTQPKINKFFFKNHMFNYQSAHNLCSTWALRGEEVV